jgi:hypothetical protein
MSLTDYYTLLAVNAVTLVLLVGPPLLKFMRLISEGQRETEAAKQRIVAGQAAATHPLAAWDDEPDPQEET